MIFKHLKLLQNNELYCLNLLHKNPKLDMRACLEF